MLISIVFNVNLSNKKTLYLPKLPVTQIPKLYLPWIRLTENTHFL